MPELFGTDGIRGRSNHYPMTPEVALRAGRALIQALKKDEGQARVIVGKDTRLSCDMIECALASGICSGGGEAHLCGVIPTPGVAFLAASRQMDAGVVISASHNPYTDNGIKFFNSRGFKISPQMEEEIDRMILDQHTEWQTAPPHAIGTVKHDYRLENAYVDFLAASVPPGTSLRGLKAVVDCSNGAAYRAAPRVFEDLGVSYEAICAMPDGRNINHECGSQHTGPLQQKVLETGADIGLAFDGDGDRLIAVDEKGRKVTGDQILAVCAAHLKKTGKLRSNKVVSTVMSNLGLHKAMEELGIDLVVTDVGDRYVLEQMQAQGAVIGGEDSGHMIFLDSHTSGDGILTALRLMQVMQETGKPLSGLAGIVKVYPQVLMNVEVKEKTDIFRIPEIRETVESVEQRLKSRGRVLVRYSGTQPLCRVMVEGPDHDETRQLCSKITEAIKRSLG